MGDRPPPEFRMSEDSDEDPPWLVKFSKKSTWVYGMNVPMIRFYPATDETDNSGSSSNSPPKNTAQATPPTVAPATMSSSAVNQATPWPSTSKMDEDSSSAMDTGENETTGTGEAAGPAPDEEAPKKKSRKRPADTTIDEEYSKQREQLAPP